MSPPCKRNYLGGNFIPLAATDKIYVVSKTQPGDIVIDIRHPVEREASPLYEAAQNCLKIPFFDLESELTHLDPEQNYLLYCSQNVMSRLQAHIMLEQGFKKVAILKIDN